jgi:hypothetical protein
MFFWMPFILEQTMKSFIGSNPPLSLTPLRKLKIGTLLSSTADLIQRKSESILERFVTASILPVPTLPPGLIC